METPTGALDTDAIAWAVSYQAIHCKKEVNPEKNVSGCDDGAQRAVFARIVNNSRVEIGVVSLECSRMNTLDGRSILAHPGTILGVITEALTPF